MAKKTRSRIGEGDWVTLQVRVTATWEDDTITLDIEGQRVTISSKSEAIIGLTSRKEERLPYREE